MIYGKIKESKECDRSKELHKKYTCRIGLYKCAGSNQIMQVRIDQSKMFLLSVTDAYIERTLTKIDDFNIS